MLTHTLQTSFPRPFLKWAGGKSQLIQQYVPYFPQYFETYHEPFLGGGAVFFYLYRYQSIHSLPLHSARIKAFITDINSELINAYCCVQAQVEELILLLEEHQIKHDKEYYYDVRARPEQTDLERAARLIYLNKTCFNGLYRENPKGEFNVPIGRYKNPNICHPGLLRSVSEALQSAQIEVRAFESILDYAKTELDFVYFDPPYYPLSPTSNFTAYSRYSFNESDQIRLRDTFVELAGRQVKVMLSNSDCPFVRALYSQFKIHEISASRMINSNAKKRGKISEVLITSY